MGRLKLGGKGEEGEAQAIGGKGEEGEAQARGKG